MVCLFLKVYNTTKCNGLVQDSITIFVKYMRLEYAAKPTLGSHFFNISLESTAFLYFSQKSNSTFSRQRVD